MLVVARTPGFLSLAICIRVNRAPLPALPIRWTWESIWLMRSVIWVHKVPSTLAAVVDASSRYRPRGYAWENIRNRIRRMLAWRQQILRNAFRHRQIHLQARSIIQSPVDCRWLSCVGLPNGIQLAWRILRISRSFDIIASHVHMYVIVAWSSFEGWLYQVTVHIAVVLFIWYRLITRFRRNNHKLFLHLICHSDLWFLWSIRIDPFHQRVGVSFLKLSGTENSCSRPWWGHMSYGHLLLVCQLDHLVILQQLVWGVILLLQLQRMRHHRVSVSILLWGSRCLVLLWPMFVWPGHSFSRQHFLVVASSWMVSLGPPWFGLLLILKEIVDEVLVLVIQGKVIVVA